MIVDRDKDFIHFGYYLIGEERRTRTKLIEFKKQGGGNVCEFGCFLIGDDSHVKREFLIWSNS